MESLYIVDEGESQSSRQMNDAPCLTSQVGENVSWSPIIHKVSERYFHMVLELTMKNKMGGLCSPTMAGVRPSSLIVGCWVKEHHEVSGLVLEDCSGFSSDWSFNGVVHDQDRLLYDKVTVLESEKVAWESSAEAQAIKDALNPWRHHDAIERKDS